MHLKTDVPVSESRLQYPQRQGSLSCSAVALGVSICIAKFEVIEIISQSLSLSKVAIVGSPEG
jgi:hypothetical protein